MIREELVRKCCILSDRLTRALIRECEFDAVTHSEFLVMRMIAAAQNEGKRSTVTTVSENVGVSKAAISQMIHQLEHKKWAERVADANDRRFSYVCLTAEGRAAYERQLKTIGESLMACFSDLTDEDMERLNTSLETIASKIRLNTHKVI